MTVLISLEGFDESGKTSTIGLIGARLRETGWNVGIVGPQLSEQDSIQARLAQILYTPTSRLSLPEEIFYACAKLAHKYELYCDLARTCDIVLVDRYHLSVLVLGHYVKGVDRATMSTLIGFAVQSRLPDFTLIFDIDYPTFLDRYRKTQKPLHRPKSARPVLEQFMAGFRQEGDNQDQCQVLSSVDLSLDDLTDQAVTRILSRFPLVTPPRPASSSGWTPNHVHH